jgi:hypothetical protein
LSPVATYNTPSCSSIVGVDHHRRAGWATQLRTDRTLSGRFGCFRNREGLPNFFPRSRLERHNAPTECAALKTGVCPDRFFNGCEWLIHNAVVHKRHCGHR